MMRLREFATGWVVVGMVVALGVGGCDRDRTPPPPSRPFQGMKLVVGVVGEKGLIPSIKAQRGEWAARTGAELVVLDDLVDLKATSTADVLVFPGDRMGDLVDAKTLAVLPDSIIYPREPTAEGGETPSEPPPDDLKYKDVVLGYRDLVAKYGPDRMALPIGGSALVVAFHRAAFDSPANREAAKAAGLALEPPKTWEQFDALARFFHGRDWDGDGQPESGLALAWGPDPEGVGDSTLLARAAAFGLHRDEFSFLLDSETTAPRVTAPAFVESLKALVGLKAFGLPAPRSSTPTPPARRSATARPPCWSTAPNGRGPGASRGRRSAPRRCRARTASSTSPATAGKTSSRPTARATCPTAAAGSSGWSPRRGRRRRPRTSPSTWPAPTRPIA